MLIKLHDITKRLNSQYSEILIETERISMVKEQYYLDYTSGGLQRIGSEITMNDCDYTKEGHKIKLKIYVTETVSEIYELIDKQIKFIKI